MYFSVSSSEDHLRYCILHVALHALIVVAEVTHEAEQHRGRTILTFFLHRPMWIRDHFDVDIREVRIELDLKKPNFPSIIKGLQYKYIVWI